MSDPDPNPPALMATTDPTLQAQTFHERLQTLQTDLRTAIEEVDEEQAKALFETAAETLGGLAEAFADYTQKDEEAWEE